MCNCDVKPLTPEERRALLVKLRLLGRSGQVWTTALYTLHVECSVCKAKPGEFCTVGGGEVSHHPQRFASAFPSCSWNTHAVEECKLYSWRAWFPDTAGRSWSK